MSNGDSGVSDGSLPLVVPETPARIVGSGVDTSQREQVAAGAHLV